MPGTRYRAKFAGDQESDPASPHSFANRNLLGEMTKRLGLKGAEELLAVDLVKRQTAAAEMLREDSRPRLEGQSIAHDWRTAGRRRERRLAGREKAVDDSDGALGIR